MSYTVVIEEPAQRSIEETFLWGVEQWGLEMAQNWYDEVFATIATLSTLPDRHALAPDMKKVPEKIRHMIFQRYRILFTVRGELVHVLYFRGAFKGKRQ
jgi:plasmid stabilization system protein ParE